jgi:hypothetical protein
MPVRIRSGFCSFIAFGGLCAALLTSTALAQTNQAPWVALFNGKDLTGWMIKGGSEDRKGKAWVQHGEMICRRAINTPKHAYVCTDDKFDDFILEVDCKVDAPYDSGILFRSIDMPKNAPCSLNGYQVKIDPRPRKWTGGVLDDMGSSVPWYYTLENDARAREAFKIGEWNTFRVEAIGKTIKVWVNGVPTAHMTHGKYSTGYIALKIHSLGNDPAQEKLLCRFRNIRIITTKPASYSQTMDLPSKAAE